MAHAVADRLVGDAVALLEVAGVSKVFGASARAGWRGRGGRGGHVSRTDRPQRLRQEHAAEGDCRRTFTNAGTVRFDGQDITTSPPYQRARVGLSLKFQITAVLRELSVYDNVLLALQSGESAWSLVWSRTRRRLDGQIMQALDRFRLADRADDLAGELSHGEQQWLEIAMALAPGPKLLLLDEPTGGMSPEERRMTGELLLPIKAECALVIVEHDIDFIKNICDHLTVLDQGRVLCDGTVREIEESPEIQRIYTSRV